MLNVSVRPTVKSDMVWNCSCEFFSFLITFSLLRRFLPVGIGVRIGPFSVVPVVDFFFFFFCPQILCIKSAECNIVRIYAPCLCPYSYTISVVSKVKGSSGFQKSCERNKM